MNERLLQFLAAENISQSQFAETIGVARASVSHIIAGRNRPGYDFICSILERYPSLNPEWILLGKGKMYRTGADKDIAAPARNAAPENSTETHAAGPSVYHDIQPDQDIPLRKAAEPVQAQAYAQPLPPVPDVNDRYHDPEPRTGRSISRIIVFYDDNTFQELHG